MSFSAFCQAISDVNNLCRRDVTSKPNKIEQRKAMVAALTERQMRRLGLKVTAADAAAKLQEAWGKLPAPERKFLEQRTEAITDKLLEAAAKSAKPAA
ncbi:MAG: hypothetical protein HDKAJFGB_00874 [Anaerolineae bacterium]|nr:hypothetical protein [Anaerolineae bacterium]